MIIENSCKERMRIATELDSLIESYGWETLYALADDEKFLLKTSRKLYLNTNLNGGIWRRLLDEKKKFYDQPGVAEPQQEERPSFWEIYARSLTDKGFSQEDIDNTETVADKVVSKLKMGKTPTKGLIIGNIQSGKTANMGAVISKAADAGFNFFIVLTGMLEKLRIQSQARLLHDLSDNRWIGLEHLKAEMRDKYKNLSMLDFEGDRKYLTFTLKQGSRLDGLRQWIQSNPEKARQLKVLVIDDEADQASPNTKDITGNEQTRINQLITDLVNGDENGQPFAGAMNYVAYTATPYANLLNEASARSLYPKDYIYTLKESRNYIGPAQLFGHNASHSEEQRQGLDIIREISAPISTDKQESLFYNGIPRSLQNAYLWFICGVAVMRHFGYKKPISMLIHIDQRIARHEEIQEELFHWINTTSLKSKVKLARDIYQEETQRFTLEHFRHSIPEYGSMDQIHDYPKFQEIESEVRYLLRKDPTHIQMEDKNPVYHDGVHICVDNSSSTYDEEGNFRRLLYPDPEQMPEKAPAFVVIGGATLARGLTLEGLISTYFARNTAMADSLTQMGRWFGYRKGYELIPRIWLTRLAYERFTLAADIDYELRKEIEYMELQGLKPSVYGPRIKTNPNTHLLKVTAKNKMQSAQEVQMNYSGLSYTTSRFNNTVDAIDHNWELLDRFVQWLEEPAADHAVSTNYVWRNVGLSEIEDFVNAYNMEENQIIARTKQTLFSWLHEKTRQGLYERWNVILAGIKGNPDHEVKVGGLRITPGERGGNASVSGNMYPDMVQVRRLLTPYDIISDIDLSEASSDLKEKIRSFALHPTIETGRQLRNESGLENVPQIILYPINGGDHEKNLGRNGLHARGNLLGIYILIPDNGESDNDIYLRISSIAEPAEEENIYE